VLTGRYGNDRGRPAGTRIAAFGERDLGERKLAIADAVNAVAAERGASSAQVAIAWLRAQQERGVIVPDPGRPPPRAARRESRRARTRAQRR